MNHKQIARTKRRVAWRQAAYTMGRKAVHSHSRRAKAYVYKPTGERFDATTVAHAQVDDATWDRVVAQLMKDYDGAWTRLAGL